MSDLLHSTHFTLDQARTVLPEIQHLMQEIVTLKRKLDARGFDIYRHEYFGGSGPNGDRYFPVELEQLVGHAREIESKGILIKDFESGLIDFPHIRSGGEEVYLCWKLGESGIEYWHRIADGFAGRRPVDEL
jgi:hypothetical protein